MNKGVHCTRFRDFTLADPPTPLPPPESAFHLLSDFMPSEKKCGHQTTLERIVNSSMEELGTSVAYSKTDGVHSAV